MWNDVVIGSGNEGNSAIRVFAVEGEHSIAENSVSYWIDDVYLGLGMTIFKDTQEGYELAAWIKNKVTLGAIQDQLEVWLLENVSARLLKMHIDCALKAAHLQGGKDKMDELKAVLGVR